MAGGGSHVHSLFVHADSHVHRLRPECKVAAGVLFVLVVVATPRETFWAYGAYAVVLGAVARRAHVPARLLLRRLTIELPFVAFAFFLPIVGQGRHIHVLGLSLSVAGLWGAWNILVKGTLGVATTVILAASTPVPELLQGLDRLRVPKAFTSVAGFMVRYLDVITEEMRRMRIARLSRGYDPRWIWQAKALASSMGSLFIRAYERGERVHLAMVSRGYSGTMPVVGQVGASRTEWLAAMSLPAVAAVIAVAAWVTHA
ncbi:MAG: cobalt/nickel transport system permease protein [Actinomycetota bacterium]|nr:cobalt/nickel transport system permease protein [Actinomycetota bacterium]